MGDGLAELEEAADRPACGRPRSHGSVPTRMATLISVVALVQLIGAASAKALSPLRVHEALADIPRRHAAQALSLGGGLAPHPSSLVGFEVEIGDAKNGMLVRLRGAAQKIAEDMVAFDWHPAFLMSRNIEAVSREPGAVNIAGARSSHGRRGGKPSAAAMAAHSLKSLATRSRGVAATMSPIAARIRQVMPATVAMKIHFSHISSRISSLSRASKPAPMSVDAIVSMRCEREPSSSPKVSE